MSLQAHLWLIKRSHLYSVGALAVVLLLGLVVIGIFRTSSYTPYRLWSFCKRIGDSDTAETIINRAQVGGFFYTRWKGMDDIWVLNKPLTDPPMFRYGCAVKFKDGHVSSTEMVDAD